MNATPENTTASAGGASATQGDVTRRDIEAVERALIDQSARGPVLTFFTTAIFWLLVSSVLGYLASKKLHATAASSAATAPSGHAEAIQNAERRPMVTAAARPE